jgi:tetratricopeptide (TPR) repeat protein
MYIPIIALCWLILNLFKPSDLITKYSTILFVLVLGLLTVLRSQVWKSSVELYTDILKKYPYSTVALNSLGAEFMARNEDNKALTYYNDAIRLSPDNYKAYYNRGLLFVKNNRHAEAISDFSKAIGIKDYTKAYAARADVYAKEKEFTKAIRDAEMALNKDPNNTIANYVLANTYSDLNRLDKAMDHYNKAIALNPMEPTFYFRRAIVHGKQQHFDKCLSDLNTSTELDPDFAEAFYWKGVAKVNLKQDPCEDLKKAVNFGFTEAQGPLLKYCK